MKKVIITTEVKNLKPKRKFRIKGKKTVCEFLEDNGLTYKYKKGKNIIESDWYNMIVDAIY